jgi:prepilin-type N-terminal cleavage/methylation domain-containing protein
MLKLNQHGFGLIELIVVAVILGTVYTIVSFQITKDPIFKSQDDVRKTDINSLADAYTIKAIDKNSYEPLITSDFNSGKIPTPPEGGQYQGILNQTQDYFFICAQLGRVEKGKEINCLVSSDNPNCYCRKSHIGQTPLPSPTFSATPQPTGIGTSSPGPSPTLSATPTPTLMPSPTPVSSNPPPVYSSICLYQEVAQSKPATVSLEGIDGTWCFDSDYINQYT